MIQQREPLKTLQVGRAFAALMVVLFHVGALIGREPGLWLRRSVSDLFDSGAYGVDFFFVLSGIVILMAHQKDVGEPSRLSLFTWKRFRRIYPIYWFFLIPTIVKQQYIDTGHAAAQRNILVIISSFLLVHLGSLGYNLLPSWTLFHEVLFYASFGVVIWNKRVGVVLCSLWLGLSFFFVTQSAMSWQQRDYAEFAFSPFHLLFAFGVLVGWVFTRLRLSNYPYLLALGLSVILVGVWFARADGQGVSAWWRLLADAGLAAAVLGAMEFERTRGLRVPAFALLLGDASYSIYLSHFMVVSFLARAGYNFDRSRHLPLTFWVVSIFSAAVTFGVVVHMFVEAPLLRRLTLSRSQPYQCKRVV